MNEKKIYNIIFGFLLFLMLNIPSIKLIYSSPIVNIGVFAGIWFFGLVRLIRLDSSIIRVKNSSKLYTLFFLLMWFVILLTTFFNTPISLDFNQYTQYFSVILIVIGIILFLKPEDIRFIFTFQFVWSTILSIINLTIGIKLNPALGQHYLTIGLPLASGIICLLLILFFEKRNILLIILLLINMMSIISLSGRTPVILSISIPLLVISIAMISEKKVKELIKFLLLALMTVILIYYLINNFMSEQLVSRFLALDIVDNTRTPIFTQTLDLFNQNIMGLGLTSTNKYGFYPHNIFLEIAISGGILALLLFVLIIIWSLNKVILAVKNRNDSIIAASIFLYYFLTWNVSFDLSSSYIPFGALAIMLISIEKKNNLK